MTQFCQSWFSRYLRFLKSCGRYNATFIPGIVLQVWYLWSPRSIVPYHVTRCITSSIDMSGPPVYGREFLSLLLNSNLLLVVQIVCSLEFLPFLGLLFLPSTGSTLSAVLIVYIFDFPVDMCPRLIRPLGMPRPPFLDWTNPPPQLSLICLHVFHEFNTRPCLSYPLF